MLLFLINQSLERILKKMAISGLVDREREITYCFAGLKGVALSAIQLTLLQTI